MRILAAVVVIAALAIPAFAQKEDPNAYRGYEIGWNVASYSRQGSANLYGGDLSFTIYPTKSFGIVADAAEHQTIETGLNLKTFTYRFGPKFVARRGKHVTTFGEVLAGGTRITGSLSAISSGTTVSASQSFDGFAFAVGGGLDIAVRPWIAVRAVQYDYSFLHFGSLNTNSNGFRVGGGLVFRFGH